MYMVDVIIKKEKEGKKMYPFVLLYNFISHGTASFQSVYVTRHSKVLWLVVHDYALLIYLYVQFAYTLNKSYILI